MELRTQRAAIVGRLLAAAVIAAAFAAIAAAGAPSVAAAQADHHVRHGSQRTHGALTPSTRAFGEQWDLLNSGQQSGTPGDDIDATRAWDIEPGGNAAVLVGFVDSGVDFDQPSLAKANLYTQTSADASACADALYGCSFTGAAGTPSDENGHGTATAGEVFSAWSGESDYAGVAPNSTLIVARVLGAANSGTSAGEAAGLDYVAERGARVVNVSITGAQSAAVHEAIATHPETLFVAAAGNSATNDDGASASYPCADPSANVICVAATDHSDTLASFSSYGANTVDLAAPGVGIPTLTREGSSDGFSGTSFAAPLVTGTAALAFAARPQATVAQVKQAILASVEQRSSLSGKTVSGGRLDAARALEALTAELPAAPPASVATPTLSGDASSVEGELTTSAGAWSDAPSTTIAWQRCDEAGGHCQTVAGASGATYGLSEADRGARIRSEVFATNGAGTEIAFSAPSAPIGSTTSLQSAATDTLSSAGTIAARSTSGGQPGTTAGGHAAAGGATPGRQAAPAQCTAPGVRLTAVGGSAARVSVVLRSTGGYAERVTVLVRVGGGAGSAKRALTLAPRARTTVALKLAAPHGTAAQRKAAKRTALVELLSGTTGVCAKRSVQLAVRDRNAQKD